MSSTLNPVAPSETQTDKPAVETPAVEQQQASNQNDTNSTAQNEVSPLKRDHSESVAASDEQTPARKKSKRIDKFKEESEALLRSFGLKEGTDSETRLTRSRTRGTPASTPVSKPEPRKATTGAKRGRKPASEKKEAEAAEPVEDEPTEVKAEVKATPQKGRGGRVARQSEEADTSAEANDKPAAAESAPQPNIAGDSLDQAKDEHKEETTKVESSEVKKTVAPVESKPAPAAQEIAKEIPKVVVTEKKKLIREPITTTNDSKPPAKTESPAVQKEETKKEEPICKPVEKPKEPVTHSIPTINVPAAEPVKETPVEPAPQQNESKTETNNLPPKSVSDLVANEQTNKPAEQATLPAESKLENDSAPEKKEVPTA